MYSWKVEERVVGLRSILTGLAKPEQHGHTDEVALGIIRQAAALETY